MARKTGNTKTVETLKHDEALRHYMQQRRKAG